MAKNNWKTKFLHSQPGIRPEAESNLVIRISKLNNLLGATRTQWVTIFKFIWGGSGQRFKLLPKFDILVFIEMVHPPLTYVYLEDHFRLLDPPVLQALVYFCIMIAAKIFYNPFLVE